MRLLAAGLLLLSSHSLVVGKPLEAVAFDLEPIELARTNELRTLLAEESGNLRRALAGRGVSVVDTQAMASEIADHQPLSGCNGCDLTIARALGADIVVTTTVQEIQYPTYSLYATVRDATTGRVLRKAVKTVESLDAEDWHQGVTALVKDDLLKQPLPANAAALRQLVARIPVPPE